MMDEMMKTYNLLMNVSEYTNSMREEAFSSFYCMLLEEWCKSNQRDIADLLAKIVVTILEVNEQEGRY